MAVPREPRRTASERFPRGARVAPYLAVVEGDAAEALARASLGWELPNLASAVAYRRVAARQGAVSVARGLSVACMVREPHPEVNPMVAGMLGLAAARQAVIAVLGEDEPLEIVWPAEIRRRGKRLAHITVESVHDGVVVGFEFDVRVGLADPLLEALLVEYADLVARYQLVDGDLRRAGLAEAILEVTGPAPADAVVGDDALAAVTPLVSRFAPPSVREVRRRFAVAEDESYELELTA